MTVPIVNAWWLVWLLDNAVRWVARISGGALSGLDGQQTLDVIDIVSSVVDIGAAVLFIVVVYRLNRAQGHWPGLVRAVAPAG